MKVLTGTVVQGRVEVPVDSIAEGAHVMIVALEPGEPIRLTPEEEEELWTSFQQIRQGEYVDGDDLIAELRAHHRP